MNCVGLVNFNRYTVVPILQKRVGCSIRAVGILTNIRVLKLQET